MSIFSPVFWLPMFLPPLSDAYDTAKMLCEKYYLAAPELKIEEFNSKETLCFCAIIHPSMYLAGSPFNQLLSCSTVFCYRVYLELVGAARASRFRPMMITMSAVSLTSQALAFCVCVCVFHPLTPPCILFAPVKAPKKPIQVVYVPSHLFHMLFELFKVRTAALVHLSQTSSAAFFWM